MGNTIGSREAVELAQRLAAWHDAMVVHRRRVGAARVGECEPDCPHTEAKALWLEALDVYGDRAHELAFLRAHGASSAGHGGWTRAAARGSLDRPHEAGGV